LRRTWFPIYENGYGHLESSHDFTGGTDFEYPIRKWMPYVNAFIPLNVNIFTFNAQTDQFDSGFNSIDRTAWYGDAGLHLTGFRSRNNQRTSQFTNGELQFVGKINKKPQVQKFKFVIAIDNPLATKTNGLPPKIFGPASDEFFARNYVEDAGGFEIIGQRYFQKNVTVARP